jgi:hypothetical protein
MDLFDAMKLKVSSLDPILPTLCHDVLVLAIKFKFQQIRAGCMQNILDSGLEIGPRWLSARSHKSTILEHNVAFAFWRLGFRIPGWVSAILTAFSCLSSTPTMGRLSDRK